MVNVIMYHYIKDQLKEKEFPKIKGINLSQFESQIKYLLKHNEPISIEELTQNPFNKKRNYVLFTFDDGYKEHYQPVCEILDKYNIKGAFYIPVDSVMKNKLLDVNKIHILLATVDESQVLKKIKFLYNRHYDSKELNNIIESIELTSRYDDPKVEIIKKLLQTLIPIEKREFLLNELSKEFFKESDSDIAKKWYLNTDEMKQMLGAGMHIGIHGESHVRLSSLSSSEQYREIESSINFLDKIYGDKPYTKTICYPYGDYNQETLNILDKLNVTHGFTTEPRGFCFETDLRTIPRYDTNDFQS